MAQIATYFAIAMIATGLGIASCAIPSIVLWFWTFSRRWSGPKKDWMRPGQYYRGEMSPTIGVSSTEGDGVWKHESIPPHECLYHRSEVLRGIRIDTLQIVFALALAASGSYLAWGWGQKPGTILALILLIPSLILALRFRILVALADPEYEVRNFMVGLCRGGVSMALVGLIALFV